MPATAQLLNREFIRREELRETPEVHVAGVCVKRDSGALKILIAKRNPDRNLFPGLYEGCGGQLARSEDFADGVKRHFEKEMGIRVEVVRERHEFYRIPAIGQQPLIPGIRFLCEHKSGEPRSVNHSEILWAPVEEIEKIPEAQFIEGLKASFMRLVKDL